MRKIIKAAIFIVVLCLVTAPLAGYSGEQALAILAPLLRADGFEFKDGDATILDVIIRKPIKVYAPGEDISVELIPSRNITVTLETVNVYTRQISGKVASCTANKNQVISLSIEENGIYRLSVSFLYNRRAYNAETQIAVVSPNERATDSFMFGVQTYIGRVYDWETYTVPDIKGAVDKADFLYDYIEYLGVNAVRDSLNFTDMSNNDGGTINYDFSTAGKIASRLSEMGVVLNLTIGATPDFAADSLISQGNDSWKNPVKDDYVNDFMRRISEELRGRGVIFELINEFNHNSFYNGTPSQYLGTLHTGISALGNNSGGRITNGGMVTGDERDRSFDQLFGEFSKMLGNGLDYMAIHSHNSLQGMINDFEQNIPGYSGYSAAIKSRMFLNESGFSVGDTNDLFSHRTQSKNTVAKMIWAKAEGYAGYVAYALGGIEPTDTNEKVQMVPYHMVNFNLEPQPLFLAYSTAIKILDGAVFVSSPSADTYVFERGNVEITVVIDGDMPSGDYFDMFGNNKGSMTDITYQINDISPDQPKPSNPIRWDHEPDKSDFIIETNYWTIVEGWARGASNEGTYKYLLEPGQTNLGYDVGGAVWHFASEQEARNAYNINSLPPGQPTPGITVRWDHEPDKTDFIISSIYWTIVEGWTDGTSNSRNVYKYLLEPGQTNLGYNAGGAVWHFASEQEARNAYNINSRPPGQPTPGNTVRWDHEPDRTDFIISSIYWTIVNGWTPGKNGDRLYKYLLEPGWTNMGYNAGGAVWHFASEQEARSAFDINPNSPGKLP